MNRNHPDLRQTVDLIDQLFDGQLSAEQHQELEKLVCESSECRQLYLRLIHQQAVLRPILGIASMYDSLTHTNDDSEFESFVSTEIIREMLDEESVVAQRKTTERTPIENIAAKKFSAFRLERDRHPKPPQVRRNTLYATVASLAAAIVGILFFVGKGTEPNSVAKIVNASDLVWSTNDHAMPPKGNLQAGQQIDVEAGLLEIEFGDGARVILEGPAKFAVQSRDAGDLQLGKLVAQVPSQAHGFRIHTPGMKIVDLGTEFGVVVDSEKNAQVRVFSGKVNLHAVDKEQREIASRLLRPGTTIEVAGPSLASRIANATESIFKPIASVPKWKRTLLAKNQEVFSDDFSKFHAGRYSKHDTYGQGGTFDFKQGRLNLRPVVGNTVAVMLAEPALRLRRGMQFSADISANESASRRVGLLISTFSGQPDGAESFGFRFNFDDNDLWVHVYDQPSDDRVGYTGKGPETAISKLSEGTLTLSVEWVNDTTFKFYCRSQGNPNRLLVDTRSIEALKDVSELYVGVQSFRNQGPLVGRCSRLTIEPIETPPSVGKRGRE